ncbi:MAG: hypothetical protein HY553_12115 [Elusimicrobia bacterium]|nr:hypothetical protein [Elusimicrobiota bacterium]
MGALRLALAVLTTLSVPVSAQHRTAPASVGGTAAPAAPVAPVPAGLPAQLRLGAPAPVAVSPILTTPASVRALPVATLGRNAAPLAASASLTLAPSAVSKAALAGPAPEWTVQRTPAPAPGEPIDTRATLRNLATDVSGTGAADPALDKGFDGTGPAPKSDITTDKPAEPPPGRPAVKSFDQARMLDLTRRLLTRPAVRKFLRQTFREELTITPEMRKRYRLPKDFGEIKEISESQFMHVLQHTPRMHDRLDEFLSQISALSEDSPGYEEASKAWAAEFREILKEEGLRERFKILNDPLRAYRLEWPDGRPGYTAAQVFVNHKSIQNGRSIPPSDLKKVVMDFIDGARRELLLNVFDFDLLDVADRLVARAEAGVRVTVGIDKNTAARRPEVQRVVERLQGHPNLTVVLVDSVALNHQKLIVSDPDDPEHARALFSSGNLTQSCIGPEGDLPDVADRPDYSVPNANHIVTLDGYMVAQVVAHNLRKTLEMGLRGDEYPLGGAFKIFGPKPEGAAEAPFILLTFSPKGGLGDINRDITRRVLLESPGPIRLMQFAASSAELEAAIAQRAKQDLATGKAFDFKAIGDGSMAVRDWSTLLWLSGWEFFQDETTKRYYRLKSALLKRILGAERFEAFQKAIRVAPKPYRVQHFTGPDGQSREVSAKLHHKVMISGLLAVLGTSFNFSENANKNQEQFLLTNDPLLVGAISAAFDGMYELSTTSVSEAVERRNEFWQGGGDKDDLTVGDQYKHDDEQAKRRRRKRRGKPQA